MTSSTILTVNTPAELLISLKDLKNSVIGNTWKKVEVVEDENLLSLLLSLLAPPLSDDRVEIDIITETAVIFGALANVGSLTLRPLLLTSTPARLISLIRDLVNNHSSHLTRLVPLLLRALRNILVSTADVAWGHMWGVGVEKRVVRTGLLGMEPPSSSSKGKEVEVKSWRREASRALSLVFEPENLSTLLLLVQLYPDVQIMLPLYQMLASLVILPSHRELLAGWTPCPGPSTPETPYILDHLLTTIALSSPRYSSPIGQRPNQKLLEASLELLAALVKGQSGLAAMIKKWTWESILDEEPEKDSSRPEFIVMLLSMLTEGPTSVRIASANCLTNIVKADKERSTVRLSVINLQLLHVIVKLLRGESAEERVRLCFILAALVSDDSLLQSSAAEEGCPGQLINLIINLDRDEERGEVGSDVASRSREAAFIALASLSFQHEPTRALIAEHNPPFLPHLRQALSQTSYGVRAAASQLARALSRSVAILRTSLIDSGVGEEMIEVLKKEVKGSSEVEGDGEEVEQLDERAWTVEIAATATICNLIADFSPLKQTLLDTGGLGVLVELSNSPHEYLALNALWAIKNVLYHSPERIKIDVMGVLTYEKLNSLLHPSTRQSLRIQALEITQNLLADGTASEISRHVDAIGERGLLDVLQNAARDSDVDLRIPALYVLANVALGTDKLRQGIASRVEILEILSQALNAKPDAIKIPSLRTLKHLIENPKPHQRPRQSMIDLLQPYQLKTRLRDLIESSPSLDVVGASVALLEVLDRGRDGGTSAASGGSLGGGIGLGGR